MRTAFVTSALVPLSVFIFACGSASVMEEIVEHEDANPTTQLVMPSDRIFAIDDFEAAGLKRSKDYKTVGLPDATGVSLFFWKVDGTPVQFEVRFYRSHDEAVTSGLSYPIKGAGPEAIIDPDFARYTEGLRDRRTFVHTRGSPTPRYGDFVVYGNLIALCEGRDAEQAAERCSRLVDALDSTSR